MGKQFIRLLFRIYFSIFYRLEIRGIENIPSEGAALVCSNHVGFLDIFLIGHRTQRLVRYMAKEELFRNPLMSAFIRWGGAFPVKRGTGDIGSVRSAMRVLKEGHILGIFPQGTRIKDNDFRRIRPKSGAALIAAKTNTVVIPVAIRGQYKLFSKIRLTVGVPMELGLNSKDDLGHDELNTATQKIWDEIIRLLEAD